MSATAAVVAAAAPPTVADTTAAELRGWLGLAAASLSLAALLALVLAASRTPVVMDLLPAGWELNFRRVLVTHVVFSFMVWCLAALAGFAAMLAGGAPGRRFGLAGLGSAWFGAGLLLLPTIAGRGTPLMSDYVPVLDDPLYGAGLVLLCLGVGAPLLRLLLVGGGLARPFPFGVAVAGVAALAAFASFAIAAARLPDDLDALVRSQLLFWGGGHLLQFAYTALTLAAWHRLASTAFGPPPLSDRGFRLLLASLLPPVLAGPPLVATLDLLGGDYLLVFTELMRWGLAAPAAVIGLAVALQGWARRDRLRHPAAVALMGSVVLFAVGGVAGYFSPGGDTRTPGHYHASLSAVNLALMGLVWTTALPRLGRQPQRDGLVRLQLWAFGLGQLIFAAGMFLAGTEGVPRKTAGLAQELDTMLKSASMALAGLGGVIAVAGGVLFVVVVLSRLLRRPEERE